MSLTPAYIEMDEGWVWWPVTFTDSPRKQPKLEIPEELLTEYIELRTKWFALQEKFEQLYRVQEGLEPWAIAPVPRHRKLGPWAIAPVPRHRKL